MPDSELREQLSINKTTEDLENLISDSFRQLTSIAFETNFNIVPKEWIHKANTLGYKTTIYLFFYFRYHRKSKKTRDDSNKK